MRLLVCASSLYYLVFLHSLVNIGTHLLCFLALRSFSLQFFSDLFSFVLFSVLVWFGLIRFENAFVLFLLLCLCVGICQRITCRLHTF